VKSTLWEHRHIIIVSAADLAAANQAAVELLPGGEAERRTFSVALSLTGLAPATDYGCFTSVTEPLRAGLRTALLMNRVASARFWRLGAADGRLKETNRVGNQRAMDTPCGWADVLADVGLAVIVPADGAG